MEGIDMGPLRGMLGSKYEVIDAHLHISDFLQEGEPLEKCLKYMDKANITRSVIFGLPVAKIWASWEKEGPSYYLGDNSKCYYYSAIDYMLALEYKKLSAHQQARLWPLIGGFNTTDRYAYRHIEKLVGYFPGMWHGLGELLFRHDDLTNLTYGDIPRCNHPGMDGVYKLAGEYKMPVCIHQNITAVGTSTYPQWLHELDETCQKNPRVTLVWAHAGVSRRVYSPIYHQIVSRVLGSYANLFVDISWVVYDDFVAPGGIPDEGWVELCEKYSERICIGSDVVRKFQQLPYVMQRYDILLDRLSPKAREDLAFRTAEKLYSTVRA